MNLIINAMNLIAQVVEVPAEEVVKSLIDLIGGVKGASVLAISLASIQVLMKFFSSSLSNFAGKYKLLIVYVLSMAAGFISSYMVDGSIMSAVLNGNVLAALQVLGNQVFVQFFKKADA